MLASAVWQLAQFCSKYVWPTDGAADAADAAPSSASAAAIL
jgi:hypothetical protein